MNTFLNAKTYSKLGSCGAFGLAVASLPKSNDNIVVITSDLCFYSGLDRFKNEYPDRFYNIGIAEQNMVSVAAGLAKEGSTVFATTYATFASTRCADQVRVDMGYMKHNIKLVGLTAGLSVGILGATHMSCEDIAIMRSIPNITVLSPADCTETVKATIAAAEYRGPVYLRLSGTQNQPIVYSEDYEFEIGKAINLREGDDVVIIATGTAVKWSLDVADILASSGISCGVVNMHTIKPLDVEAVYSCCKAKLIVTIEEHSIIGGLGSAVSECLSVLSRKPPQMTFGIDDRFTKAASYTGLLKEYGLTAEILSDKIQKKYNSFI